MSTPRTVISLGNSQKATTIDRINQLAQRRKKSLELVEITYSSEFLIWVAIVCTHAVQQSRNLSKRAAARLVDQLGFRVICGGSATTWGEPSCFKCCQPTELAGVIDRKGDQRLLIYFACETCRSKAGGDTEIEKIVLRRNFQIHGEAMP